MNYAAIFPACRAVVHHGGAGTTAAGLRAGVPTLVLWATPDRQMWGAFVKRLKVGAIDGFRASPENRWSRTCGRSWPRHTSPGPARSPPR